MSATWQLADTIAALASPPGPAPRGILRLSGPAALATFRDWFVPHAAPPRDSTHPPVPAPDAGAPGNDGDSHSPPDQACDPAADPPPGHPQAPLPWDARTRAWRTEGSLSLPALFDPLEVALHCWPGRRSYTGEPVVEVHTLGSPVLLNLLLEELFARGVRPARPGEFTLRAFLAGRLDLTQAEAVLGVIDADSPAELHAALQQLAGGVSREFDHLRADLLDLLADLEAGLDFADEEIEFITPTQLADRLEGALRGVVRVAGQARDRQRDSARWRVVLAGPPNAGKSTLFNALAGQAAALVSPEAGTTRDWLARDLDLAGLPVTLVDTAGHEPAHDEVSRLSQARQAEQVARADLLLWCLPADGVGAELARRLAEPVQATDWPQPQTPPALARDGVWGPAPLESLGLGVPPPHACLVFTKADAGRGAELAAVRVPTAATAVSAHQPESVQQFREWLAVQLAGAGGQPGGLVGSTAARAADSLRGATEALERALALARHEPDQELLAVEVREALAELGKITGAVYTDDILDRIFSKFCIGK